MMNKIETSPSGINHRLGIAEEKSNEPKDQLTETLYSEQDKEKSFKKKKARFPRVWYTLTPRVKIF